MSTEPTLESLAEKVLELADQVQELKRKVDDLDQGGVPAAAIEGSAEQWLSVKRVAELFHVQEDMADFEAWRSADPRHTAAFARIAGVTQKLDQVKPLMPRSKLVTIGLRRRHFSQWGD